MTRYSFSHCCCHLGAPLGHLCNFVAICCFFRSDTTGTWSRTFVYFLEFLDVIIFCSIILIVCLLLFSIIFTILHCLFLKVESILENTEHCINHPNSICYFMLYLIKITNSLFDFVHHYAFKSCNTSSTKCMLLTYH